MNNAEGSHMGDIVSWSARGLKVKATDLQKCADDLDMKVAVDAKRWDRCYRLALKSFFGKDFKVTEVKTPQVDYRFQVNRVRVSKAKNNADAVQFDETKLFDIDSTTGDATYNDGSPADDTLNAVIAKAKDNYATRPSHAITKMVDRYFARSGVTTARIRQTGGVYFVPSIHLEAVDTAQRFVESVGEVAGTTVSDDNSTECSFVRFRVNESSEHKKAVTKVLRDHMTAQIDALRTDIEAFDDNAGVVVMQNRLASIKENKAKVEAYSVLLEGEVGRLNKSLAELGEALRAKIEAKVEETAA